jgi:hypothetical protein
MSGAARTSGAAGRARAAWIAAVVLAAARPAVAAGSGDDGPAPGSAGSGAASGSAASGGSAGSGSAGSGSAGSGGVGSGGVGSGSAGSGGAGSGSAGSGSAGSSGPLIKMPIEAGAPQLNAAAAPTVVNLGAHFTLYVTATFRPGLEVNLREPLDLGPAFEIRRRVSEDRSAADGRTIREWQIDVTPWELGDLQVAPIAVTFTAFGRAGQTATNAVPLKVVGVLGDAADDPSLMRGLAAPSALTMRDWLWIWVATAAAAALGVTVTALWLGRRRQRRALRLVGGAIARPARIDMTGERALERLLAIEQSGVLDRDAERKSGYTEMVEVIRDYLAARYRIAIHDRTSSELIAQLGGCAPPGEIDLVRDWLEDCDVVKYGGARATPAEAGKALDDARALIVTTTALRGARPSVQEAA